ncbi:MBOAT family protein [Myxococcota bacterium]|nr:MBOAT family protein [Myxococcota bacterium]
MLFNSLTFVLFFVIVLTLHHLPLAWRFRKANLLVASYLFYAAWNPPFVVLLWISTLTDWFAGRRMARSSTPRTRRALLGLSLGVNLGLLAYFKYASFLLDNFVALLGWIGIDYRPAAPDIILPLGISFYTFQTLSYTFSIYRGESRPSKSFLDYALFVTFFPQLVAGPILRSTDFLPQCAEPRRASPGQMGWGMTLLVFGLFQKVVLADGVLAPIADPVYAAAGKAGAIDAWLGTLAFTGQIFFDFAGYSSCAIGAALCLGFVIPENFRCPYAALGFSDFWRRWHVSLSSWLRDYVYITAGGNRVSIHRTYLNLMFTMLVGGLWHGAAWHFVVWGGLHGLYLAAERRLRPSLGDATAARGPRRLIIAGLTFALVTWTWTFFRAESLAEAWALTLAMVTGGTGGLLTLADGASVLILMGVTLGFQWRFRDADLETRFAGLRLPLRSALLAGLLIGILLAPGDDRAFIYFQF